MGPKLCSPLQAALTFLTTTMTLVTLGAVVSAAVTLPRPLLVTYWGQDTELSLQSYCNGPYNVVVLGFIDHFGSQPLTLQMNSASCSTYGPQSGCSTVASDIKYCQSKGVKILMSMGGATAADCAPACNGTYWFDNGTEANNTATVIWQMFLGGSSSSVWRPFGSVVLDGIDLDIEEPSSADNQNPQYYYDQFMSTLRGYDSNLIISGAPECKHGCPNNCTPLEQTFSLSKYDYLFVQFYNDASCGPIGSASFDTAMGYWTNLTSPTNGTTILIGAPGSNRSNDASAGYYVNASTLVQAYQKYSSNPNLGGIGIWQASSDLPNSSFIESLGSALQPTPTTTSVSILPSTASFATTTAGAFTVSGVPSSSSAAASASASKSAAGSVVARISTTSYAGVALVSCLTYFLA